VKKVREEETEETRCKYLLYSEYGTNPVYLHNVACIGKWKNDGSAGKADSCTHGKGAGCEIYKLLQEAETMIRKSG